jgi:hypothetical protein
MMEFFINAFVQVSVDSLYLTDDTNHAVFANDRGQFSSFQLINGGHYEVHGDGMTEEMLPNTGGRTPFTSPVPTFSFAQRPSAHSAVSTTVKRPVVRTFQR